MTESPKPPASGKRRGSYAAVVYRDVDAGDDGLIWRCIHEHRTLKAARECNVTALAAYDLLNESGVWMGLAGALNG